MLAMNKRAIIWVAAVTFGIATVFTACKNHREPGWEYAPNMYDSKAYKANTPNANFKNGQTDQYPPAHTRPLGFAEYMYADDQSGYEAAGVSLVNPLTATEAHLEDGKSLYLAFCSPCHGEKGDGNGHLVQIGKYGGVPSYSEGQSSRGGDMATMSAGKIYHTIMYGLNNMGSYASQLKPEQRWEVVMYVQQLQIKK